MKPYYSDNSVTIYHGNALEIAPTLDWVDLLLSDPPYPNNAGHFDEGIGAAKQIIRSPRAGEAMVFWHKLHAPDCGVPLVAKHIWHRTNTNRPDNYEAIYEFAVGDPRSCRVFPFPVVYPGLTGCVEATGHPTQKNLKLMQALIQLRSCESIVDPFMGSGTTLEAAKRLGKTAIGIEVNERYCEIAATRLSQEVFDFEAAA